jgi:hypothetical protein
MKAWELQYEIGHAPKGRAAIDVAVMPTALQALETVESLQASDEEIRFIRVPGGPEIGTGELRLLAEQEVTLLPKEPSRSGFHAPAQCPLIKIM